MGYRESLEAAGAEVLDFKEIGSYQGTWGAIVNYEGKKCLVTGSYGSCSGCDAFQAEFSYYDRIEPKKGKYYRDNNYWDENEEITAEQARELNKAYDEKLANFGRSYLTALLDLWDVENRLKGFKEGDWFDEEEKELFTWAKNHLES